MTPHIQQTETAELNVAPPIADFSVLEATPTHIEVTIIANDNSEKPARRRLLEKRRRRRARLWAR